MKKIKTGNLLVLVFAFSLLCPLSGCGSKDDLEKPKSLIRQSQNYYQRAVGRYKDLIKKGKDLDRLYFELGKVYYDYGSLEEAIEALKKTNALQARKFLAISFYKAGNFTDALEIFNRHEVSDEEYLYYKGLTCEKLNLFDKALETYKKIKDAKFAPRAMERLSIIEKHSEGNIRDLSEQTNKILAQAPLAEKYPQAGALILLCDEKVEIGRGGTQVSKLHYLVKIINERGKESFAETHVDYDSTFEKVELEYARTIKPDGSVVEVGLRHIRDVSKYLNFPLYSNVRVFIISFPEITEGSTIEYKLKIHRSQLINKKDFVLSYPVQSSEPVIDASFSVSLPKSMPLHKKNINEKYNTFGAGLNPVIREKDGLSVYDWSFKDIPQILPESNMPSSVRINPSILMSTFQSWKEIYDWWWNLARDKIKADESIKAKVAELIINKDSEEAKARAIYNFCARDIRYVAVEYGQAGYEPHFAADIFKNKYGDCKDQAILLVTMLKEAGFLAWPVLIATKEYYNLEEDFPAVLFNHCIAALSLKGKTIFLDPTAETCSFGDLPSGDQARRVLVFKEGSYEIQDVPLRPAQDNRIRQRLSLRINSDETIAGVKENFSYGIYDQGQRYWLLYTPPQLVEERLNEKLQEVSIGSRLDNYNIKNLGSLDEPVVLSYAFHGPEYFTNAGPLRIMPQLSGLDTSITAKDKRRYPIDFGILDTKELEFEIEIPAGFIVKYIPADVKRTSQWFEFTVENKTAGNKIYFTQKTELKKKEVAESEYPDFKKFIEEIARQSKQRIVLEKIK